MERSERLVRCFRPASVIPVLVRSKCLREVRWLRWDSPRSVIRVPYKPRVIR